jgi:CrcB protein
MIRTSMYFWVALGGALDSMTRCWMGTRITVLAGLAFPWATILINILGSLVIGFLATLTDPQGSASRLLSTPVPF